MSPFRAFWRAVVRGFTATSTGIAIAACCIGLGLLLAAVLRHGWPL